MVWIRCCGVPACSAAWMMRALRAAGAPLVGAAERMRRFGWSQPVWYFELAVVVALPTVRRMAQFRLETVLGRVSVAFGRRRPSKRKRCPVVPLV